MYVSTGLQCKMHFCQSNQILRSVWQDFRSYMLGFERGGKLLGGGTHCPLVDGKRQQQATGAKDEGYKKPFHCW